MLLVTELPVVYVRFLQTVDKNGLRYVKLVLKRAHLEDAEVASIVAMLEKTSSLLGVDFEQNYIGDQGALLLANLLIKHKTLEFINLADNTLGNVGLFALSQGLERNSTLRILDLENNIQSINAPGRTQLLKAIALHPVLEIVHLGLNAVDDQDLSVFCQYWTKTTALKELHLQQNCLTDKSGLELSEVLLRQQTLRVLNLEINNFTTMFAQHFLKVFDTNIALRHVSVKYQDIDEKYQREISDKAYYNTLREKMMLLLTRPPRALQMTSRSSKYYQNDICSYLLKYLSSEDLHNLYLATGSSKNQRKTLLFRNKSRCEKLMESACDLITRVQQYRPLFLQRSLKRLRFSL